MFKRSRDILEVEEERSKHSSVVVSMLDGLLSHLSESHAHDRFVHVHCKFIVHIHEHGLT